MKTGILQFFFYLHLNPDLRMKSDLECIRD